MDSEENVGDRSVGYVETRADQNVRTLEMKSDSQTKDSGCLETLKANSSARNQTQPAKRRGSGESATVFIFPKSLQEPNSEDDDPEEAIDSLSPFVPRFRVPNNSPTNTLKTFFPALDPVNGGGSLQTFSLSSAPLGSPEACSSHTDAVESSQPNPNISSSYAQATVLGETSSVLDLEQVLKRLVPNSCSHTLKTFIVAFMYL